MFIATNKICEKCDFIIPILSYKCPNCDYVNFRHRKNEQYKTRKQVVNSQWYFKNAARLRKEARDRYHKRTK